MSVTRDGYLDFIRNIMGISTTYLPDDSDYIDLSLAIAQEIVNEWINTVSSLIFDQATYNLAGDTLINIAQDQPGETFFYDLREKWGINSFVPGVIESSHDETTGQSMLVPEFMKELTLGQLQNLKTPYGRQYLAYAQTIGTNWGLS